MTTNHKLITRQIPIGLIALDAAIEQEIAPLMKYRPRGKFGPRRNAPSN